MKSISSLYKDYLRKELIIFDEDQLSIISKLKGLIPKNIAFGKRLLHSSIQRKIIKKVFIYGVRLGQENYDNGYVFFNFKYY